MDVTKKTHIVSVDNNALGGSLRKLHRPPPAGIAFTHPFIP